MVITVFMNGHYENQYQGSYLNVDSFQVYDLRQAILPIIIVIIP